MSEQDDRLMLEILQDIEASVGSIRRTIGSINGSGSMHEQLEGARESVASLQAELRRGFSAASAERAELAALISGDSSRAAGSDVLSLEAMINRLGVTLEAGFARVSDALRIPPEGIK